MTRDDLIRMADKAGFDTCRGDGWPDERLLPKLKEFAALLRDRMVSEGWRQCAQGQKTTQFCAVAEQARQEEREWLAAAIERQARSMSDHFETRWLHEIAAAVRARGKE